MPALSLTAFSRHIPFWLTDQTTAFSLIKVTTITSLALIWESVSTPLIQGVKQTKKQRVRLSKQIDNQQTEENE